MNLSRRAFFGTAAAALKPASAKTLDTVGVQLYTVRSVLPDKPAETLQALDEIGYREAEAVQAGLDKIWPMLVKTRLKPVSIHVDQAVFAEGREADLDAAIADAKRRGFAYFVYPYMPPAQRNGIAGIRRLAERLNRAGEKCRAAGMRLCYHNHAFEFDPKEGKMPIEVLMQETAKDVVGLELDIFWVKVAGHDPVAMLKQYSGRVQLLHLKNVAPGTEVRYNESVPKTAFQEVGAGVLDIPAILRAAEAAGVKHWFVEQDQTPGDPVESLRQSFNYLKTLNY
jgi:sugar phosphate isomerase/epimerase